MDSIRTIHMHDMRRRTEGFTLITLMIVVAIIGIIASIAYPSYRQYVNKTQRADGTTALMVAAQELERCYTTQMDYGACTGVVDTQSEQGYYQLSVSAGTTTYTITATPQNEQAGDPCGNLTLDEDGKKGASGGSVDKCW